MSHLSRYRRLNEQAHRVGIAERTLRSWVERGWLVAARMGRSLWIADADLEAAFARRRSLGGTAVAGDNAQQTQPDSEQQ